jgi:diguanylate cyclase (GGDEF)-like protein
LNFKSKDFRNKIIAVEKNNIELIQQTQELQFKIELLAAGREISLILNEEVNFETILKKSLDIAAHLCNPHHEAEEVTIFLKSDVGKKNKLDAVALRTLEKTYFEEELRSKPFDNVNVRESFEHQRLFLSVSGEIFDFTVPLIADREAVGVIKVKTLLDGTSSQKTEKTQQLQSNLMEFAKIIALAIKTPALYTRAITDHLTGLFSKRHFINQLESYFDLSMRYKQPLSMVLLDIDHFKRINDNYGHPMGDMVLRDLSKIIQQNIRKASSAYRYGGEEIAILLPNTNIQGAINMAERLRKKIEGHRVITQKGNSLKVTASLGVAEYKETMNCYQDFINESDKALYMAKEKGRNRVCRIGNNIA